MSRHRVELGRELVVDMARLEAQMKTSKHRIRTAVAASGTSLTEIYGCGPICAAMILGHTGNIERFATRSHYASYNATAPNEASSGPRPRHRVNLRGNRQLNWAIHMIAVTQIRQPYTVGRVYDDRKIDEGKTSKEALRALKRQISDVVYRHLIADTRR